MIYHRNRRQGSNVMMSFKGYTIGPISFDPEERTFSATAAGLKKDVIHFEGTTAEEFVRAFHESVDEYLKFCAERGHSPDHSFSGPPSRVTPDDIASLRASADRLAASLGDIDEEEFAVEFVKLRRKTRSPRG